MTADRILWPLAAGMAAAPLGWIVTHGVLALTGYSGDPAGGPAFTGAAIFTSMASVTAFWLTSRKSRSPH